MTPLCDNATKAQTAAVFAATIAGAVWALFFPRRNPLPAKPQPVPGVYRPEVGLSVRSEGK